MIWTFLFLFVGFASLIKGADFLVSGSSSIAKKFNISNLAIGLTVVALGTSTPELAISILSALNGNSSTSFGNVIGSNNFNTLFILGVAGLIYPLAVQRSTVKYEVPLSIVVAGVLLFLVNDVYLWGNQDNIFSKLDAYVMLGFFGLFMFYIFRTMKHNADLDQDEVKVLKTWISVVMVVVGIIMLVGGGKVAVDSATSLAAHFGLSAKLIGLTILAIGTSLPELVTSCVAAYRKNTDIAIGNVVGSNIFNLLLILGITGSINPMNFDTALNVDLAVVIGGSVVLMLFMFTLNTRKLDRWEALILVFGYISYTLYLIDRN